MGTGPSMVRLPVIGDFNYKQEIFMTPGARRNLFKWTYDVDDADEYKPKYRFHKYEKPYGCRKGVRPIKDRFIFVKYEGEGWCKGKVRDVTDRFTRVKFPDEPIQKVNWRRVKWKWA